MVRLEHPRQTGQNVKHQVMIIPVFVYIYFTIYGAGHAYVTLKKLSCFVVLIHISSVYAQLIIYMVYRMLNCCLVDLILLQAVIYHHP